MDPRVSMITLSVEDPAAAASFYEALGWTPGFQGEAIQMFQLNGLVLSLYEQEAFREETGLSNPGPGAGRVVLAQNMESREAVDEVIAEVEAAGGRVVAPAVERFWGGYSGYVADPEGHLWEIAWNPELLPGEEGDVHLG